MDKFKLKPEREKGYFSLVLQGLIVKKNIPETKAQNLKRKTDKALATLYGVTAKW